MTVEHQFLNKDYFFPNWDVTALFIGTFNPVCGQKIEYYYRRKANGFWQIMTRFYQQNSYDINDFQELRSFMIEKKFGCVDVIKRVSFPDTETDKAKICGKGYSDNSLFTVRGFKREYNFDQIKKFISEKKVNNVFSTWGERKTPKEFNCLCKHPLFQTACFRV